VSASAVLRRVVSKRRIIYAPQPHSNPQVELNVLAHVYAFALQKHRERQQPACGSRPDDAEDLENDRTANENYTG
jgi:hypothetical protein